MADDRVDVEINDKVSPTVRTNILAIADAAIKADDNIKTLKQTLATINASSVSGLASQISGINTALKDNTTITAKATVENNKSALSYLQQEAALNRAIAAETSATLVAEKLATQQQRTANATQMSQQSAEKHAASLKNATNVVVAHGQATNTTTGHTVVFTTQMMAAQHAARGFTEMMIQGVPVTQALGMQMSHLSYAATGQGGIVGAFKGVANAVLGWVSPTLLGLGVVVAGVAVLGKAWHDYESEITTATAVTQGAGRYLGLTADQFTNLSIEAAKAGKITVSESLELGAALARTGSVGIETITLLQGTVKNFAATMGTDIPKATQQLVKSFSSFQGISELNKQLNFMSAAELDTVQSLYAQGKGFEGSAVAADKYKTALVNANDATSQLGKMSEGVISRLSAGWSSLGKIIDTALGGGTAQERVLALTNRLLALDAQTSTIMSRSPQAAAALNKQKADLQSQIDSIRNLELEKNKNTSSRANDADLNRQSQAISDIANKAAPAISNLQQLKDKLALLNSAANNPELQKRSADMETLAQSTDAYKRAVETFIPVGEQQKQLNTIDLQMINATSAAQRAKLAQERERVSLAGQVISSQDAQNRITQAGTLILNEAAKARREEFVQLDSEQKLYGLIGPQREIATQLLEKELAARRSGNAYSAGELETLRQKLTLQNQSIQVQQQLDNIYQNAIKPAQDYNNTLIAANQLLTQGKITVQDYGFAIREAQMKMLDAGQTAAGGFKSGIISMQNELSKTGDIVKNGLVTSVNSVTDSLANMVVNGGFSISTLSKIVQLEATKMILKLMILKPLMDSIGGFMGGGGGPITLGGPNGPTAFSSVAGQTASIAPGQASGGDYMVQGQGGIDRNLIPVSKGERVLVQTPEQYKSNGDSSGQQTVNIIDQAGVNKEQNQRTENGVNIVDIILTTVKNDYANGGFDKLQQGRYGQSPLTRKTA